MEKIDQMPSDKQKTVTVPLSLWERWATIYEADKDRWRDLYNVRSVTGLVVYVLRREARILEAKG